MKEIKAVVIPTSLNDKPYVTTIKDDYKVIRSANKERITKLTFIAGLVFAIIFLLIQYKEFVFHENKDFQ